MSYILNKIKACEANSELSDEHSLWSWREQLLYFDKMLYISHTETLQDEVILKHHNNFLPEHLVTEKTFALIQTKYYWSDLCKQVQKYCDTCFVCQRVQIIHSKQSDFLQSIFILTELWDVLTLDFITKLPDSSAYESVYNAILVAMCKFFKMTHYISVWKDWTAD